MPAAMTGNYEEKLQNARVHQIGNTRVLTGYVVIENSAQAEGFRLKNGPVQHGMKPTLVLIERDSDDGDSLMAWDYDLQVLLYYNANGAVPGDSSAVGKRYGLVFYADPTA